jgi:hypothetical protein
MRVQGFVLIFVLFHVISSTAARKYRKRTIELNVFVDSYLWNQMKAQVKVRSSTLRKRLMRNNVRKLIDKTEALFRKSSISAYGGFDLVINRIKVLTEKDSQNSKVRAVDDSQDQIEQLKAFRKMQVAAYIKNDRSRRHYDMSLLLSGKKEEFGISSTGNAGAAYTNTVCTSQAIGLTTVTMEDGKFDLEMTPSLLAHEMGHILGARYHDGEGDAWACEEHKNIMTSSQKWSEGRKYYTWSNCSRAQIDKLNGKNDRCFYE